MGRLHYIKVASKILFLLIIIQVNSSYGQTPEYFSLLSKANTYYQVRDYEQALHHYHECSLLDVNHNEPFLPYMEAKCCVNLNDSNSAILFCDDALNICYSKHIEDETFSIIACFMADLYTGKNMEDKAIEIYRKILPFYIKKGGKSMEYISMLRNFSTCYAKTDKLDEAIKTCKEAVDLMKSTYGEDNNDYAELLDQLGSYYDLVIVKK